MRKYSKQRAEILQAARENLIHPTADDIYRIVREHDPTISLGTVYRNLNILAEDGEILKIPMPSGKDRYDGNTIPHHHVTCRECGKVFDFDYDMDSLPGEVSEQCGVEVSSCELVVFGLCSDCRNQNG